MKKSNKNNDIQKNLKFFRTGFKELVFFQKSYKFHSDHFHKNRLTGSEMFPTSMVPTSLIV